jgi:hypothetical protein
VVKAIDRFGANRIPAADDPEKDLLPEVVVVERREGGIQAAVTGARDHFAATFEQFSARSVIALDRLEKQQPKRTGLRQHGRTPFAGGERGAQRRRKKRLSRRSLRGTARV